MKTNSKNDVSVKLLDNEAALKLAQYRTCGGVSLTALDCNWAENAANSYFHIWVAVSFHQGKDKVFLHGARYSNWNLDYEMTLANTINNMGLYSLSLSNPDEFPDEFVLRLERETGEHIYDNNDYHNYFIEHGGGHCASAVKFGSGIVSFETITPVKVYV
ncbi:MAG: hypothetical protein FWC15_07955 [Fibromonadales bacterium]|nr:hypothetical protein [Fibromonadales bacterium]